jgi:subtilase family serine protease
MAPVASIEALEPRLLMSDAPVGLTPRQIRHAYNFDQIAFQVDGRTVKGKGQGQTIAIIGAYNAPRVPRAVRMFDLAFGLPDRDWQGQFPVTKVMPFGRPEFDEGWALEAYMDVEWAHAIAPKAHVMLVEAKSAGTDDLLDAIDYARHQPGVVSISMSWGGTASPFDMAHDDILTTPSHHGGIMFVSSSGDNGGLASWPSTSANVISVGGTTLEVDAAGNYIDETAWEGSGGGPNTSNPFAGDKPDVAYVADPDTGVAVFSPVAIDGETGWRKVGGTSAGAPQWAALFAIVDQGRAYRGHSSLDSADGGVGAVRDLPGRCFHEITEGSGGIGIGLPPPFGSFFNNGTGRGTPIADRIASELLDE